VTTEKRLQTWTECVGRFVRLEIDESQVSVVLSCRAEHILLSFPKDGPESEILQRSLSSVRPGAKVALLKTDDVSKPILVRLVGHVDASEKG